MKTVFLYNTRTRRLHIKGFCPHTKGLRADYPEFASENEALAYDGRAVSMCKPCQKEREKG